MTFPLTVAECAHVHKFITLCDIFMYTYVILYFFSVSACITRSVRECNTYAIYVTLNRVNIEAIAVFNYFI